jgi:predicted membrane-bound spermidine synthase
MEKSLIINGKADASSHADLNTQILLGQVPLMVSHDTGRALVIGLGSGVTSGTMLKHPIKSLDCVEISPEVVDATVYFTDVNNDYSSDPRFKIHVEDGIAFLQGHDAPLHLHLLALEDRKVHVLEGVGAEGVVLLVRRYQHLLAGFPPVQFAMVALDLPPSAPRPFRS